MKALEKVIDPEIRRSITDLDMVQELKIDESGHVFARIALTIAGCPLQAQIEQDAKARLAEGPGVTSVEVEMGVMSREELDRVKEKLLGARPVIPFTQPDSLTRVYAITSGKGGVGKSSVTANLAAAMADSGLKVAVLDCDIYGFSIPRMLGLDDAAPTPVGDMMMPPTAHGVKVISMGMFVPDGQPVVWRGPVLAGAVKQFWSDVIWGELDVLFIDMPPGTGDVPLTVYQSLPISGNVIVTTPQSLVQMVVEKAYKMAQMLDIPVLGVVENMSYVQCPDCGKHIAVFGDDAATEKAVEAMGSRVLARLPMDGRVAALCDSGEIEKALCEELAPAADAVEALLK